MTPEQIKNIKCSFGKPMTYEEMMKDRASSGAQIKKLTVPKEKTQLADDTKSVIGHDGTVYRFEEMKKRREKKQK